MHVLVPAALVALLVTPVVAFLAWNRVRTRRHTALLVAVVAVAAAWFVVVYLVSIDYRDADGFVDCWPHCSRWLETVRLILPLGPLVALALVGVALVSSRARR